MILPVLRLKEHISLADDMLSEIEDEGEPLFDDGFENDYRKRGRLALQYDDIDEIELLGSRGIWGSIKKGVKKVGGAIVSVVKVAGS